MKTTRIHIIQIVAAILLAAAFATYAQSPSKKMAYENFKLLRTRNIFDPDRTASSGSTSYTQRFNRQNNYVKPKNNDYVALTGIMATEEKSVAFFAGSSSDYNKVVPLNGIIAGGTITKITPSNIEVKRDGRTIVVAVGQTVPFDDSAPGAPPVAPDATPAATTTAPPAAPVAGMGNSDEGAPGGPDPTTVSASVPLPVAPATTSTPSPASAGDKSDVIRRMMERRQQQLK